LLEPDPEFRDLPIYRTLARRRPDFVGAGMVFSPTTVTGTAVLEYGPTEILPPVGALSKHAERLCRPGRQASRAHPRGKPGFWTFEKWMRPRDRLAAGASRIRTLGPPATVSSVGALWRSVASGGDRSTEAGTVQCDFSARRDSRTPRRRHFYGATSCSNLPTFPAADPLTIFGPRTPIGTVWLLRSLYVLLQFDGLVKLFRDMALIFLKLTA
jgi:hypothetical protein